MTLEESIDKAIKAFLDGEEFLEIDKVKPRKYNKKYFDEVDAEMFPTEEELNPEKKVA